MIRALILATTVSLLPPSGVGAQTAPAEAQSAPAAAAVSGDVASAGAVVASEAVQLSLASNGAGLFDGDDELDRLDQGLTLQTTKRTRRQKPRGFAFSYTTAVNDFSQSARLDRWGHRFGTTLERQLSRAWSIEAVTDIAARGSLVDRDALDQYTIMPRLEYRVDRRTRVRAFSAIRTRRYDLDRERNSVTRSAGLDFRKGGAGAGVDMGLRYEINGADLAGLQYNRWVYNAGYDFRVGARERLSLDMAYRVENFDQRAFRSGETLVLRRDYRWVPSATWTTALAPGMDLRFRYVVDNRDSNDVRQSSTSSRVTFMFARRW